MALLYEVDLRTLPSQTIGAAGAYTIDGKTWWAKGQLTDGSTTLTTNLVNGSGLHYDVTVGGGTTPIGQASALAWRHFFLPFSALDGWDPARAYMVRARFSKNGSGSGSKPFIGVTSTTSDAVGLTATHRANEVLVAPTPNNTTVSTLDYKIGTAAATTATGRAGTIANGECVVGVYHFTPRFALLGSEHLASGMPLDPTTWLAVQSVAAADFSGLRSNPGVLLAVDSGNNDWYLQQLRVETIGDTNDLTPPTIENISPAPGALGKHQAITFDLVGQPFALREFWIRFGSTRTYELVHDGSTFDKAYDGFSDVEAISEGLHFELRRATGWPSGKVALRAVVVDGGGNVVVVDA